MSLAEAESKAREIHPVRFFRGRLENPGNGFKDFRPRYEGEADPPAPREQSVIRGFAPAGRDLFEANGWSETVGFIEWLCEPRGWTKAKNQPKKSAGPAPD